MELLLEFDIILTFSLIFLQNLKSFKKRLSISIQSCQNKYFQTAINQNIIQTHIKNQKMFSKTVHLKIMVIGATGAGKSSLINLFYVWSLGIQATELGKLKKALIRTSHLDGDGQTENLKAGQQESVTNSPKPYSFELYDKDKKIKYDLSFLDTPGLGDTRGMERDEQNISMIIDSVQKTENLNAILLMMNGSDPRVNSRVKYVLAKLQGMLPNVFQQNLFILLSNVDLKPNLKIQNEIEIDKSKITSFNNQIFALAPEDYEDQDILYRVGQSYQSSIRTLSRLLGQISKCTIKPTQIFQKLKTNRDQLKKKLVECTAAQANIHTQKNNLLEFVAEISKDESEIMNLRSNLTEYITQQDWVSSYSSCHNTSCLSCKKCCHYNCGLQKTGVQGSSIFQTCAAFNGSSYCNQCGHHYQSHVHLNQTFTKKTTQVPRIKIEVQNQITGKQNQKAQKQANIAAAKKRIDELDKQLSDLHKEIEKITVEMKGVCSRFDYVREIQACINVLEEQIEQLMSDASNGDSNVLQKLQSYKETKESMKKLRDNVQKHLSQRV